MPCNPFIPDSKSAVYRSAAFWKRLSATLGYSGEGNKILSTAAIFLRLAKRLHTALSGYAVNLKKGPSKDKVSMLSAVALAGSNSGIVVSYSCCQLLPCKINASTYHAGYSFIFTQIWKCLLIPSVISFRRIGGFSFSVHLNFSYNLQGYPCCEADLKLYKQLHRLSKQLLISGYNAHLIYLLTVSRPSSANRATNSARYSSGNANSSIKYGTSCSGPRGFPLMVPRTWLVRDQINWMLKLTSVTVETYPAFGWPIQSMKWWGSWQCRELQLVFGKPMNQYSI